MAHPELFRRINHDKNRYFVANINGNIEQNDLPTLTALENKVKTIMC